MLIKHGLAGTTKSSGAAFTPADLFAGSETGFVIDFNNATFYTDDYPGTTTQATNGQQVGSVVDNVTGKQWGTTSAATFGPTLVISGATKYLHFDSDIGQRVFDSISTAFSGDYSLFMAARFLGENYVAGDIQTIVETPSSAGDGIQLFIHDDAGTWKFAAWTADFSYASTAITVNADFFAGIYGGNNGTFWRDGATDGTYTAIEGVSTFNRLSRISDRTINMRLYGLVIRDTNLTTTDMANLETYYAGNMP